MTVLLELTCNCSAPCSSHENPDSSGELLGRTRKNHWLVSIPPALATASAQIYRPKTRGVRARWVGQIKNEAPCASPAPALKACKNGYRRYPLRPPLMLLRYRRSMARL